MTEIKPEHLETKRLFLKPPIIEYAEDVFEYSNDKLFNEYITSKPAKHVSESENFLKNLINDNINNKRCYWAIIEKECGKCIGTLGFIFSFALQHKVVEFGYGLSRKFWGLGIFQEAAAEVLKFIFYSHNFKKVQVLTREDNISSIKSIEKLGFKREGNLISFYETENGRVNSVLFGMTVDDFRENLIIIDYFK